MLEELEKLYDLPTDQLIELEGSHFYHPSNVDQLLNTERVKKLIQQLEGSRLTFISRNINQIVFKATEFSQQTYSWFNFIEDKDSKPYTPIPLNKVLVTEMTFDTLTNDSLNFLRSEWRKHLQRDLSSYSQEILMRLEKSFESVLSEGMHLLYSYNNKIIGHASYVDDLHPILKINDVFLHIWIDIEADRPLRKSIHSHFFQRIKNMKDPGLCGVSVTNHKSLNLFSKNGYRPVLLSTRS